MKKEKNECNPLVSVSLLLWHSKKFAANCLKSLFVQDYENWELLVADNNESFDAGVSIAKETIAKHQGGQKIIFFSYGRNIGFAAGHNRAITQARGKYILLLNQDVVLADNFLTEAVAVLEKDSSLAAVQSRCLRMKEIKGQFVKLDIIDSFGLVVLKNRRIIGRGQGRLAMGKYLAEEEIFGVDGAAPLLRRSALEDAKIFLDGKDEYLDEDFLSYKEDVDLAWRLRLLGWKAVYSPRVIAWHARGSGDSAARNYFSIIKERLKLNKFAKCLAFKNQRLMQIKNEQPMLLLKHLLWFLPKEIASWIYVILFEHYTWKAIGDLLRQAPTAWKKRKIIMAQRKLSTKEMEKWFL